MNDEFRQMVIEKLRRGEPLPAEWARELFPPERREYELVYHGKEREEDILAETMAVPLQPVSTFGKDGGDWHNMLILGDNLQVMKTLLKMKEHGQLTNADGTAGVRLVYIDPPFATQREFRGSQEERAYQDKVTGAAFLEFLRKRLALLRELMSADGALYVHLDHKKGHYAKVILDELLGEHNYRNGIARIKCNPKNYTSRSFGNIHDFIFFYARNNTTTLNEVYLERVLADVLEDFPLVDETTKKRYKTSPLHARGIRHGETGELWRGISPPSGNHWRYVHATLDALDSAGLIEWSPTGNPRKRIYAEDSAGYAVQDIWDFKDPGDREARYPTEKSEELLTHIVKASSQPGDIVLDAFAGSGTALAAAEKLGRRWIGIDSGKLAIYTIQKRMLNLKSEIGNKGDPLRPKPFTLYNAGLYDFSTLRQLPWADWRFFALQLFGCKDEPHAIGGLKLDGKLRGASVLVFNHLEHSGQRIDEDTVRDIHLAVGKKIGQRFFIIAPRATFDFQQDYIDFDGVRYYALRIPYSIINELHHREFSALQQPNDETAVNDTVDAVGFDFIQPPRVEWTASVKKRRGQMLHEACLKIKRFESRARLRGVDTRGGLETLSMLMLDFDYDGDVFNLDAVFYAHQLQANHWQAWFPADGLGRNVMAVFIDIYGNEAREIIPRDKFRSLSAKPASAGTKEKPQV